MSGIVVFPSLGQYAADRVGAGTGVLLPSGPLKGVPDLATFVGIALRDDAGPVAIDRLVPQLGQLDESGFDAIEGFEVFVAPV